MATIIARRKKVTDPLDDKVKARIFGEPVYISSGSEHSSQNDDVEGESPCLSHLLCSGALDDGAGENRSWPENDSDSDSDSDHDFERQEKSDDIEVLNQKVLNQKVLNQAILNDETDQFRNVILGQVNKALEIFWFVRSNGQGLRRNVMAFLRSSGYNAGICKSKWETSGGLIAGNYEFIDVIRSDDRKSSRYLIDLNFAGEFAIARQTNEYERLLRTLPIVYVGKSENLKQVVKVMSDGARRSLKSGGLHVPPWRKNRFMQNKWFGQHKRTVNLIPAKSCIPVNVKCQSIGFDAVDRRPFIHAATRTR